MSRRSLPRFYTEHQMIALARSPTGLRTTELRSLTAGDLHGDRLFVARGKGGRQRWVPLSADAVEARTRPPLGIPVKPCGGGPRYLDTRGPLAPGAPLFTTRHGRPMSRSGLSKLIRIYDHRAGFEMAGPHRLRHPAATNWLNRCVALTSVQKLLGHAHLVTTSIDLHLATDAVFAEYHQMIG